MDNKFFKTICIILPVFLFCCSTGPFAVSEVKLGSSFIKGERIPCGSTTFSFKKPPDNHTHAALCDHLYFQGDTLTFAIKFNRVVQPENINIEIHTKGNLIPYKPEQIRVKGKTVSGFTLIGSLLEHNFKNKLNNPVPRDLYSNHKFNFIIRINAKHGRENISKDISDHFIVKYF